MQRPHKPPILFVSPWLAAGGIARNLEIVAPWLARKAYPVAILAWNICEQISGHCNPVLRTFEEGHIPVIPLESHGGFSLIQKAALVASHAVRRRAQVIAGYQLEANLVAVMAKMLLLGKVRAVLEIHNASNIYEKIQTSPRLLALARILYRRADCLIAVSESIREDTIRFFGVDPARIVTVYNPVSIGEIRARATSPKYDTPSAGYGYIVGCGRLAPAKGFTDLIQAFSQLNSRSLKLVILGIGQSRQDLLALATRLGIDDRVILPGFVPNPYPYFAGARAFVLPSHSEALPTVLVEAMACKTPVIASRCEWGPEEILQGGRFGQLYPVGDIQALSKSLEKVLAEPPASDALAQAAARAEDFAAEKILPQLEQQLFGFQNLAATA